MQRLEDRNSSVSEEDQKMIVEMHNGKRSSVQPEATNMLRLSWDDEVAMIAQKWADKCDMKHEEKNTQRDIPGRFSVGQNIAMGAKDWWYAIEMWHDEVKDFKYGSQENSTLPNIGNYTQIVDLHALMVAPSILPTAPASVSMTSTWSLFADRRRGLHLYIEVCNECARRKTHMNATLDTPFLRVSVMRLHIIAQSDVVIALGGWNRTLTAAVENSTAPRDLKEFLRSVSEADKKIIVDMHNEKRSSVNPEATNMLRMSWDDEVAMIAQKWADNCDTNHEKNNLQRVVPDCGFTCLNDGTINTTDCTCKCLNDFFLEPVCRLKCKEQEQEYCRPGIGYSSSSCEIVLNNCPVRCRLCPYAEDGYSGDGTFQVSSVQKPILPNQLQDQHPQHALAGRCYY
ncbi:hypothetical protein C0Q70_19348 [Pomacea canaliculata]|uniref:SCP domain-containing protein n=1 Tax=Pomacea canaliculata TaxID=400727 RepID=A0A2T7NJ30_POMCA|nr:hypothetical protein C0Q70_19348 [Pomacea canaliculata]